MPLKQLLLLPLLFLISLASFAQHACGYTQRHFGARVYHMHPRNFAIAQDARELLYFGNAYGILEYDGSTWRDIPLINGNSGLSLLQSADGRMYVGSYNELGYLTTDSLGSTVFKSLLQRIKPSLQKFETIHAVFQADSSVVFFSSFGFYIYEKDSFRIVPVSSNEHLFQYACSVHNTVYVNQVGIGLCVLEGNNILPVPGGEAFQYSILKTILPLNNKRLLILEDNGLFVFESGKKTALYAETNRMLNSSRCTQAMKLPNGDYLITTLNKGMYLLDASGKFKQHIHQGNGLSSNTINVAYTDKRGGLWLALDNGISYVEINAPFSYTGTASGVSGMGYAAAVFNNRLYLGTSQGLFVGDVKGNSFEAVHNIQGEVWNLSVIDNTLLCCQRDQLFQIKDNEIRSIPCPLEGSGNWKTAPLKDRPGYALKGTYEGFQLYRLVNGDWKFERKIKGFEESSRIFLQTSKHEIWMCHGNKGMYKLTLSEDLSEITSVLNYTEKNGFPADFFNDVTLVDNELIFSGGDGLYRLDPSGKTFVKNKTLEQITGAKVFVSKLVQYPDQNLWLFSGNDVRLYRKKQGTSFTKEEVVFRKIAGSLVGSYEFLLPVSDQSTVIGSQEGFIFYHDKQKSIRNDSFPVMVRRIEATFHNDSLLYGGNKTETSTPWDYDLNALRFTFSAQYYENPERVRYQYALSSGNNELQWSAWTANTQVEYSNLHEGKYIFHVRAKNIYEEYSTENTYSFEILPPWYRSSWAYVLYALLLIVAAAFFTALIRKRFQRQREKLEEEKRKELQLQEQKHLTENLQIEKELMALRNEKLESEVVLKNTELASLATTLTQKSEFLTHLKEKLESMQSNPEKSSDPAFKEIIKTIDQDLDFDDDWAKFQIHFDELHHNFLHRLRERFPKLKPSWLLLCAYIRMNKSNKEIASHLNISVAAVEKRKYRLKEKLELEEDTKLSDYLVGF